MGRERRLDDPSSELGQATSPSRRLVSPHISMRWLLGTRGAENALLQVNGPNLAGGYGHETEAGLAGENRSGFSPMRSKCVVQDDRHPSSLPLREVLESAIAAFDARRGVPDVDGRNPAVEERRIRDAAVVVGDVLASSHWPLASSLEKRSEQHEVDRSRRRLGQVLAFLKKDNWGRVLVAYEVDAPAVRGAPLQLNAAIGERNDVRKRHLAEAHHETEELESAIRVTTSHR